MGEETEKVKVRSGERGHVCVCVRERENVEHRIVWRER